jgi:hypothetical protein
LLWSVVYLVVRNLFALVWLTSCLSNLRTTQRTPRDAAIALACRTAGRSITADEWKTHFPDDAGRATCDQFPLAT